MRKLAPEGKAPILCFVGPPGVGKTSLGQSIARAMGRKFVRVSLGGVHDEAEIRGHRRTYIGALPGNIIQAIRKAGARDCVMMLDEIDKMGRGIQGDPSAAMLEVLDPEQNARSATTIWAFRSTSAAWCSSPPPTCSTPFRVRCATAWRSSRLLATRQDEKLQIARRYLVRRQLEANGLKAEQVEISDEALRRIIRRYTREAGVRNLEREIGRALRHAAVGSPKAAPSTCASTPRISPQSSVRPASRTRWRCAPACPGSPRVWRGRRSAATSCSSRPPARQARAALSSPGSSAMLCVRAHRRR